ncbi:hypothetical protein Nepgr_006640 [Nepenthes gracilis]|uniref:Uncharacterized protein n=1 Tax=Nepenthes gracilis TaxID=150966 RepID=A0AAD3XHM3_NEPGR|nr:hypothetical protein Nepgr_006640 [Nepenthes gracilis]
MLPASNPGKTEHQLKGREAYLGAKPAEVNMEPPQQAVVSPSSLCHVIFFNGDFQDSVGGYQLTNSLMPSSFSPADRVGQEVVTRSVLTTVIVAHFPFLPKIEDLSHSANSESQRQGVTSKESPEPLVSLHLSDSKAASFVKDPLHIEASISLVVLVKFWRLSHLNDCGSKPMENKEQRFLDLHLPWCTPAGCKSSPDGSYSGSEAAAGIQGCRIFSGSPGGLNFGCEAAISWHDGSCLVMALALSYCVGATAQVCYCGPGWSILQMLLICVAPKGGGFSMWKATCALSGGRSIAPKGRRSSAFGASSALALDVLSASPLPPSFQSSFVNDNVQIDLLESVEDADVSQGSPSGLANGLDTQEPVSPQGISGCSRFPGKFRNPDFDGPSGVSNITLSLPESLSPGSERRSFEGLLAHWQSDCLKELLAMPPQSIDGAVSIIAFASNHSHEPASGPPAVSCTSVVEKRSIGVAGGLGCLPVVAITWCCPQVAWTTVNAQVWTAVGNCTMRVRLCFVESDDADFNGVAHGFSVSYFSDHYASTAGVLHDSSIFSLSLIELESVLWLNLGISWCVLWGMRFFGLDFVMLCDLVMQRIREASAIAIASEVFLGLLS